MRGQQTEADRIAELRDDPQCRQFDAHRCLCAACGRWVHLSGRAHKIFNWRRHKKGCTPLKSRGAITIIQSRSPSTIERELDELDDEMEEEHSSSYTQSDEGHASYYNYQRDEREGGVRLPSISTFSLSSTPADEGTPPLSSSVTSAASDSFASIHLHQRSMSSSSFNSLPPHNHPGYSHHHHEHHHRHHHRHRSPPSRQNFPPTPQKSNTYDPVFASRVQCDSCAVQLDLPEWTAHKRLCRSRSATSLHPSSRHPAGVLPHRSPPPPHHHNHHIMTSSSKSSSQNVLPPLSAFSPISMGPFAFSSTSPKESINLPPISMISHSSPPTSSALLRPLVGSQSPEQTSQQQRPGRRISDLIHHHHHQHSSSTESQNQTPTPQNDMPLKHRDRMAYDQRGYRAMSNDKDGRVGVGLEFTQTPSPSLSASPSPSSAERDPFGMNGMMKRHIVRSLSPPSPFHSDMEN